LWLWRGSLPFVLSSGPVLNTAVSVVQTAGVLVYIEPMCIEAHVYDLYIHTLLGLEEYTYYSLHQIVVMDNIGRYVHHIFFLVVSKKTLDITNVQLSAFLVEPSQCLIR